jgi:hypothetical protein
MTLDRKVKLWYTRGVTQTDTTKDTNMSGYISGQIVEVKINGLWYEAEILDIYAGVAYVYVYDTGEKKNVANRNIR